MSSDAAQHYLEENLGEIVLELRRHAPGSMPVMVVGARCRDTLHLERGHTHLLARTEDVDIALAIGDMGTYNRLTDRLEQIEKAHTGVRFRIADRAVDLVPFGRSVEDPAGVVAPRKQGGELSVFGYATALSAARAAVLASGHVVYVPTAAGYTLLKLKAWIDRSARGEYKDAGDIAVAMHWYQSSAEVHARFSDEELASAGYDDDLAAVSLLARDVVTLATADERAQLAKEWQRVDDDQFAWSLQAGEIPGWPANHLHRGTDPRLLNYAACLRRVLCFPTPSA